MAFFLRSLKFTKIHLRFALINIIACVNCYEFCANFFAPQWNCTRLVTKGKVTREIFHVIRSARIGKSQGTWTMVRVDKTEIPSVTPTPLDDELKFSWNTSHGRFLPKAQPILRVQVGRLCIFFLLFSAGFSKHRGFEFHAQPTASRLFRLAIGVSKFGVETVST